MKEVCHNEKVYNIMKEIYVYHNEFYGKSSYYNERSVYPKVYLAIYPCVRCLYDIPYCASLE